jgi:hypothetical protein
MRRYPDAPCGTHGGYVRHVKYGETPCDGCREGHRRYMSEYRRANPKKRDKDIAGLHARKRAIRRLIDTHRDEFDQLLTEEAS